ncbi:hypothetical protein [uncultured Flavobacterium sp.]|uniref:hypothetical protein n=1 Tax=uncultured Flavobacterium sp. TaxID=165435 RepID=UPI0030EB9A7B
MVGFSGMAKQSPPPPPAGTPPPPGFPVDGSLFLMVLFGIIFSFIFLKKYSTLSKKA